MRRLGFLSLCLIGMVGCSDFYLQSTPAPLSRASFSASNTPSPVSTHTASAVYTVKRGDTLYSIARQHGSSIQQLASLNRLSSPYTLQPGQQLQVTQAAAVHSVPPRQISSVNSLQSLQSLQSPQSSHSDAYVPGYFPSDCRVGGQWQWPVKNYQSVNRGNSSNLKIYGVSGQTIHAAAPGKVIYSGPEPGLSGHYSNLIIIQHNSAYHSVYAGNRGVRVSEGSYVNAGQAIADMGSGNQQRAVLQFEIRCRDKAVDPLRYLPRNG